MGGGGQSGLPGGRLGHFGISDGHFGCIFGAFWGQMGDLGGNGDITVLTRISVIPTINVPGNVKMVNAPSTGPRSADARAHLAAPSA